MTTVLLELVRHKTWATRKLIALCQSVEPALIDATTPGTYGTIRSTLVHLVNADRNYYRRLCAQQPWERMHEETTDLQTVADRFEEIAAQWESLAADSSLAEHDLEYPKGEVVKGAVVFAQSIHHGDVHRAHVLSILGSRGVLVPELDLWEYGFETGLAIPPSAGAD
jgi:uncharacterized damage-inducible protein DinB